jgi:hypothetical protein
MFWEIPSKETGYFKVRVKGTETDKQWTDDVESRPCGLQEVEECFDPKPHHWEDQPLQLAGSKCKTVITGLKLAKKIAVLWVPQKTNQEKI